MKEEKHNAFVIFWNCKFSGIKTGFSCESDNMFMCSFKGYYFSSIIGNILINMVENASYSFVNNIWKEIANGERVLVA